MSRVIVCGYMIRHPVAGNVFAYLQYVIGLLRLGHEVVYLEQSGWPNACYDPATDSYSDSPAAGIENLRRLMAQLDLSFPFCYVNHELGGTEGVSWHELQRMLGEADLLLDVGGVCWMPELRACRRRALVDMDPFFTQIGQFGIETLEHYHVHFSYGVNIGRPGCRVPTAGVDWRATVPPGVRDLWHAAEGAQNSGEPPKLTTIANWQAYGGVEYEGELYGQKDVEFRRFIGLPARVQQPLEIAIGGAEDATRGELKAAGWHLRDALEISAEFDIYRDYIAGSYGEFSTAKNAYVKTHSGWFSDRTVSYLACGRPVVVQDTGFTDWLSADGGVLPYATLDEAVRRIEQLAADYEAHSRAANAIFDRYFDSGVVLSRLLDSAIDGAKSMPGSVAT